jgi:hypothetical protein
MAEIKITDMFGKRTRGTYDSAGEAAKSALSGVSGARGRAFSAFDAGQNGEVDRIPSSRDSGGIRREDAQSAQKGGSLDLEELNGSDSSKSVNISFGSGAIVVNDMQKSSEEIARDIVKPLSRELKKLGYLSS